MYIGFDMGLTFNTEHLLFELGGCLLVLVRTNMFLWEIIYLIQVIAYSCKQV